MSFKTISVLFAMVVCSLCHAGEWIRISPTAISFDGDIEEDDFSKFQNIYKPTDETLILNSTGGRMDAALDIGSTLVKNKSLTVVVRGICASSCANYLFLAGHTRRIEHGIVGFHGDWKAMVASDNFKKELLSVAPESRAQLLAFHAQRVRQESEFLSQTGADQSLFDKTQKENDEGLYDLYVPGPRMLESYGIHGVIGSQDMDVVSKNWPTLKVLFDNGPANGVETSPTDVAR